MAPYTSECINYWTDTNYTDYIDEDWAYSLQQCQRVCTHSSILMDCQCFHPMFLDLDAPEQNSCNLTTDCKLLESNHFKILKVQLFVYDWPPPLHLCPIYLKLLQHCAPNVLPMHKKFEVHRTKIKGSCQLHLENLKMIWL